MKFVLRRAAALAAASLCACSARDASGPAAPEPPRMARLEVRPHHSRLVLVSPQDTGRSRQLSTLAWDAHGNPMTGGNVTWASTADAVQVDAWGKITLARVSGPARVRAQSGGITAEALVCPVVFQNDLEDTDVGPMTDAALNAGWNTPTYAYGVERVAVVDGAEAYEGGRSLRVLYPRGSVGPGQGGTVFGVPLGASYDELYASYMVRFGPGFEFALGGKLPGLAGGTQNSGGVRPNGRDGWSARGMWWADGKMIQYVYHPDQSGEFGDGFGWTRNGRPLQVVPDRWYHVEHHVVMNTPGQRDGMIQAWLDGELVLDRRNLRFRDVRTFGIDAFQFSTFFGGNQPENAARKDEYIYYDNVVISTFRIGPHGAGGTPECQPDTDG